MKHFLLFYKSFVKIESMGYSMD